MSNESNWEKTDEKIENRMAKKNEIQKVNQPITDREKFFAKIAVTWRNRAKYLQEEISILNSKVSALTDEIQRVKTDKDMEHQEYISRIGETEQLANEVDGMLRKDFNVEKRVTANLMSLLSSVRKVEDAISNKKPKQWFKFTWEIAAVVIFIVFVWQYGYNPAFKDGVDKNALLLVVLAGVIAFIVIRIYRGKNKK